MNRIYRGLLMNNYLISVELGAETYLYNIIDGTYKISSEKNNEYN